MATQEDALADSGTDLPVQSRESCEPSLGVGPGAASPPESDEESPPPTATCHDDAASPAEEDAPALTGGATCVDESIDANTQMHAFLRHGTVPCLGHVGSIPCASCGPAKEDAAAGKKRAKPSKRRRKPDDSLYHISNTLSDQAKQILDRVRARFDTMDAFVEAAFGPCISRQAAHTFLTGYLKANGIAGKLNVQWDPQLNVGGRVFVALHSKHPEKRRFTLKVYDPTLAPAPAHANTHTDECAGASEQVGSGAKSTPQQAVPSASTVLRQQGIVSFADHELGCHLVRSLNDGHQVWAGRRKSFGLQACPRAQLATEEGLASLHSALASKAPTLFFTALLYYTAACAATMGFTELFNHLEPYVPDPHARFRQVARAKYGMCRPEMPGGNGKGQAYFEGNVAILQSLAALDIRLLYCGKLTLQDMAQPRIKRLARTGSLALPSFVKDAPDFLKRLRALGVSSGIIPPRLPRLVQPRAGAASQASNPRSTVSGVAPTLPSSPQTEPVAGSPRSETDTPPTDAKESAGEAAPATEDGTPRPASPPVTDLPRVHAWQGALPKLVSPLRPAQPASARAVTAASGKRVRVPRRRRRSASSLPEIGRGVVTTQASPPVSPVRMQDLFPGTAAALPCAVVPAFNGKVEGRTGGSHTAGKRTVVSNGWVQTLH